MSQSNLFFSKSCSRLQSNGALWQLFWTRSVSSFLVMTVHPCTMACLPFTCWRKPDIPFVAQWVRPPAPHGPGCPCLPPWLPVHSGQTYGTRMSIWLELLNRCWHFVNHPVNFSSPKSQQLVPLNTEQKTTILIFYYQQGRDNLSVLRLFIMHFSRLLLSQQLASSRHGPGLLSPPTA